MIDFLFGVKWCCFFVGPGNPVVGDWLKIMKSEHCNREDSFLFFETSNYGIKTCPANEWKITTERDEKLADMKHDRKLPDIQELLQRDIVKIASLTEAEVVAIVLYTGPMVSRARAEVCCEEPTTIYH